MLAGKVQRHVVCVRYRVDTSRSGEKALDTLNMAMDNGMYQWRKVVVIDQIDSAGVC